MGWILILLLLAGGGVAYYFLTQMEQEIRAELSATENPEPQIPKSIPTEAPLQSDSDESLDALICRIIKLTPGILQTELYQQVPDYDKKMVQKELLILDRSGSISRVRAGNTYQLNLK